MHCAARVPGRPSGSTDKKLLRIGCDRADRLRSTTKMATLPEMVALPDGSARISNEISRDSAGPTPARRGPLSVLELREQAELQRRRRVHELLQEQALHDKGRRRTSKSRSRRRRGVSKKRPKALDPLEEEAKKIAELKRRKRVMKTVKLVQAFSPAPQPEPEQEPQPEPEPEPEAPELTYDGWLEHYASHSSGDALPRKDVLAEWHICEGDDPLGKLVALFRREDEFNSMLEEVFKGGSDDELARAKFSGAVRQLWVEQALAHSVPPNRLLAAQQRLLLMQLCLQRPQLRTSHFTHMSWDTSAEVLDKDGVGHGGSWIAHAMADEMTADSSPVVHGLSLAIPELAAEDVVSKRAAEQAEEQLQAEVAAALKSVIDLVVRPPGYSYKLRRDFTHPIWGIRKAGDRHSGDMSHCTLLLQRAHMHNGWARQGHDERKDSFSARVSRIAVVLEKEWKQYGYPRKMLPSRVLIDMALEQHEGHAGRALEALLPAHVLDTAGLDSTGRRKSRRPSALPKFLRRGSAQLTPPATPRGVGASGTGSDGAKAGSQQPPPATPRGTSSATVLNSAGNHGLRDEKRPPSLLPSLPEVSREADVGSSTLSMSLPAIHSVDSIRHTG